MGAGERIGVAMLHGPAPPDQDGVSDYVARLLPALATVDVESWPVPVRPGPGERWLSATLRAARAARRLRPDLVHVQFSPSTYHYSGAPGLLPALLAGAAPLVTTVHEYGWWATPHWVPDRLWRSLERARWWDRETGRLVPASRAVVVSNPAHAAEVSARTGAAPVELPLAPNVVPDPTLAPSDRLRDQTRARLGLPATAPVVAFFGFVHPVKGLRYVIEALPELRAAHPELRLLVVGGFVSQALPEPEARAFQAELTTLADRCGVSDAVTFTGHLPAREVCVALAAADLAVLPFVEGLTAKSGSLLTVLGHGLPTAVTLPDAPGEAAQIRDG